MGIVALSALSLQLVEEFSQPRFVQIDPFVAVELIEPCFHVAAERLELTISLLEQVERFADGPFRRIEPAGRDDLFHVTLDFRWDRNCHRQGTLEATAVNA